MTNYIKIDTLSIKMCEKMFCVITSAQYIIAFIIIEIRIMKRNQVKLYKYRELHNVRFLVV